MEKWEQVVCPVCFSPIANFEEVKELKEEYKDEIYRPGDDIEIGVVPKKSDTRRELEKLLEEFNKTQ